MGNKFYLVFMWYIEKNFGNGIYWLDFSPARN